AGPTLPRALNGGHLMWRVTFASEDHHWAALVSEAWRSSVLPLLAPEDGISADRISYRPGLKDVSDGRGQPGIWRCLVLSVDAGTSADTIRQFERDTASMPQHVSTIRNWSMGHVVAHEGRRNWTHVWEQEFDDLGGLEGEYMTHPIHWGLVDGWFDPECPQRIVDPLLIHAAMDVTEAVII
ncbi:MAG: Dabb family protein, partial [Novosphingobium sp.]|nr:Dabb family protein [Novosphingobium sp.]